MNHSEMIAQLEHFRGRIFKRQRQQLKLDQWIRLVKKINHSSEDVNISTDTEEQVKEVYDILVALVTEHPDDPKMKKAYHMAFRDLVKHFEKTYGFVAKGTYVGMYMGIGIALGAVVGFVTTGFDTPFYAVGIALGLSLGVSLGSMKENALEKQGKLY